MNILVIKHGAFGDMIQATGVLSDIRNFYRHANITLLTTPGYHDLMARCPDVDHILLDMRAPWWQFCQHWRLGKTLRQQKFSRVIDLQNSSRTRWYRKLVFPGVEWLGRLDGGVPRPGEISGLKGLAGLLQQAGIPVRHIGNPDLSWMRDDVDVLMQKYGLTPGFVLLAPGSSARHPEKRWPHYPALARELTALGVKVATVLGPEEKALAEAMPGCVLTSLSWFQLAGLMGHAACFVGNDSGPSHLASALGRTGLALFGPTTSAGRAEIRRAHFQALEVDNLENLPVHEVRSLVMQALSAAGCA